METLENTLEIQNENKRIGSNFLGILNDLKRRHEDAARELSEVELRALALAVVFSVHKDGTITRDINNSP